MRNEILSIASDLKEGSMSLNEAKERLKLLINDTYFKKLDAELINYCGFTPTNKNNLTFVVFGEENYINNNLNIGDKVIIIKIN